MSEDQDRKDKSWFEIWGWIFVSSGLLNGIIFTVMLFKHGRIEIGGKIILEGAGQVGSFIGGTTGALWALAGVLFFVSALRLQREDLRLQREDNRRQLKVMEGQQLIFEQQTYETTFFNMLNEASYTFSNATIIKLDSFMRRVNVSRRANRNLIQELERGEITMLQLIELEAEARGAAGTNEEDPQWVKSCLQLGRIPFSHEEVASAKYLLLQIEMISCFREHDIYMRILLSHYTAKSLKVFFYAIVADNSLYERFLNLKMSISEEVFYHPSHAELFNPQK